MIHELKIHPKFFNDVRLGKKTFEIRKNDRPFREGDFLALNEYDQVNKLYTGNSIIVYVDYILNDPDFCKDGYVVMGIKPCDVFKRKSPINQITMQEDYSIPLATKKN